MSNETVHPIFQPILEGIFPRPDSKFVEELRRGVTLQDANPAYLKRLIINAIDEIERLTRENERYEVWKREYDDGVARDREELERFRAESADNQ